MAFGTEKLEWHGYQMHGEKMSRYVIRFERIRERYGRTNRRTDGQTPHDG